MDGYVFLLLMGLQQDKLWGLFSTRQYGDKANDKQLGYTIAEDGVRKSSRIARRIRMGAAMRT